MNRLVLFSISKYFEIAVLSTAMLILANKIGPLEMALAMPILLYVTYSNYLNVGSSQLVLKYLSRLNGKEEKIELMSVTIVIFIISSFAAFLLSSCFITDDFWLITSAIVISVFFKSFMVAYLRVEEKFTPINMSNIIASSVLLVMVLCVVDNLSKYLYALFFSNVLYIIITFLYHSNIRNYILNLSLRFSVEKLLFYVKTGVKISFVSFLVTVILTIDKIMLQNIIIEKEFLGTYQLADNIGTAVYMIFTTIFYFFYPIWLKKIDEDKEFEKKYCDVTLYCLLGIPLIVFVAMPLSSFFSGLIFPDFTGLELMIPRVIALKLSIIYLTLSTTLFISKSREFLAILLQMSIIFSFALLFIFFNSVSFLDKTNIPLVMAGIILTFNTIFIYDYRRKNTKTNT